MSVGVLKVREEGLSRGWSGLIGVGLQEILAGSAVAPLRGLSTLRPCDGAKKGWVLHFPISAFFAAR